MTPCSGCLVLEHTLASLLSGVGRILLYDGIRKQPLLIDCSRSFGVRFSA